MNSSPDSATSTSASRSERAQGIEDIYPLAPLQEGLLFHTLYAPESPAYFMQGVWTLSGELRADMFRAAWQHLVSHHQVLRTFFVWERREQPLQVVLRQSGLPWEELDWRGLPADEQQRRLENFLAADRQRGFDLARAPLMRVALIRLGGHDHRLVWSHHHILMDGWCASILLRDLFAAYAALCQGRPVQLARPRPYRDYIAWLQRQDLGAAEVFWRQELAGFASPTQLHVDLAPGQIPSQHPTYVEHRLRLSESTSAALHALARRHQITLNTVLQGAWALLLSRYSGADDVVFGITVAGRPADLDGAETMVGLFINTLPLRLRVAPSAAAISWLQEVQAHQIRVREYEYSPLSQIQAWSDVPRGTPLLETLLVFQNFAEDSSAWDEREGVQITGASALERTSYPLTLAVIPGPAIDLRLVGDSERFDDPTTARLLAHLRNLLTSIAERPQARLDALAILDAAEHHELVVTRNATAATYPTAQCYHQLVEAQAARTPDAVALAFGDQRLSYRELDARANQLAHHLQAQGVRPNMAVGICMERGIEMMVGLLGIMKAGAAFLPLDPAFPVDRMAFMLEDGQVRITLTQARLREQLPQDQSATLCLDDDWPAIAERPSAAPPATSVTSAHLAYVIYTSGSTGRPKGVMIPHYGLVNYLHWCIDAYTARHGSGAPVQSSIAADAIFPSLFAPLLVGNRVLMLPGSEALEGLLALTTALQQEGPFGLVKITPTQLEVVNQQLPDDGPSDWVRTLVIGAEALRGDTVRFWQQRAPQTTLLNEYGPTETVVGCSIYQLPPTPLAGAVPIGLPIANTQFYVLDRAMQPVPVGLPGELYIGGDGVAYGYQSRPDLTAKVFVPDPFHAAPGARLYKTGDLVKYLPDRTANIEFLGRIDDQVKIRGYRVELGEVEATLVEHPAVQEVAVLVRDDGQGVRRLVAYVVPVRAGQPEGDREPQPALAAKLRTFLQERLPDYMVPEAFVLLPALPLTPHGKLNRAALPLPERASAARAGFVAPRTPLESALAAIWASVLKVEQVGVHDNFFELGGDSLLSIRVVTRAKQAGLPLQPRLMFQHRTIAGLAAALPETAVDPELLKTPAPPPADQGPVSGPAPLISPQHWLLERSGLPHHQYHNAIIYEVAPDFDPGRFREALRHVITHHDMLRARFQQEADGWRQYIDPPGDHVPLLTYDLSGQPEAEQRRQIEQIGQHMHGSPDLATGPLRVAYFNLGPGRPGRLLMMIHHLVTDGVSLDVLFEDLLSAYQQLGEQQAVRLPPKTTSFKRWAERLHEYARSPAIRQEFDYWTGLPWDRLVRLPLDFPENRHRSATVDNLRCVIWEQDAQTTAALLAAAHRSDTSLQEVLLAAYAYAISQWAHVDTVQVMVLVHGRHPIFDDIDLSRTIGWISTGVPLILSVEEERPFGEVVESVKAQYQRVPLHGIGAGILENFSSYGPQILKLQDRHPIEVQFNYNGQSTTAGPAPSSWLGRRTDEQIVQTTGLTISSSASLLDWQAQIRDGQLVVQWGYNQDWLRRTTIEQLAQHFADALAAFIGAG